MSNMKADALAGDALGQAKQDAQAAGINVAQWQVRSELTDGFELSQLPGGTWRVAANNGRSALWAVRHVRDGGAAGTYRPRFSVRGVNIVESLARHTPQQMASFMNRMADWRFNRLVVHPEYGYREHADLIRRACAAYGIELIQYINTNLAFLADAPASCLAKNPAGEPYFQRVENEARPCPSEPRARELFREGARAYFASDHICDGDRFIVLPSDGVLICRCASCRNLSAIEQWQPFLEIAVDEARKANRNLSVEFISYVLRFALPRDMGVFRDIDGVMFDLHRRYRFAALDQDHPHHPASEQEAEFDPRAGQTSINRYLLDRLRDWRGAYHGTLYTFENLMIQGSVSCPQPYTMEMERDLELCEQDGVDGVVYEAFEPGVESFARQIRYLSRRMWNDDPAALDRQGLEWSPGLLPVEPRCYPFALEHMEQLERSCAPQGDAILRGYLPLLKACLEDPTWANYGRMMRHVLGHRERFDWMVLGFQFGRRVQDKHPLPTRDQEIASFMAYRKLWDFMERTPKPREQVAHLLERLAEAAGS